MKILKREFEDLKVIEDTELIEMNTETALLISSCSEGLLGMGEILQVAKIEKVSPMAVHNLGSMLVALGHVIQDTADNRHKIDLARKK